MAEKPTTARRHLRWIVLALVAMFVLAACAAGPNASVDVPGADGDLAGFWTGLWHGIIIPVAFFVSLFTENVSVYEVHNTGGWYDFGFVFGASLFLGGGAGASKRRRR